MKKIYKPLLTLIFSSLSLFLAAQSTTFNYTGSVQTFTVPACVTSITVDVRGAAGGNNGSYLGGLGGRVQASVPVTPGEVLNIYVGQLGVSTSVNNPAVFGGGGGVYSYVSGGTAGTGGGASDIRRTPYGNADRLVVAGGGGGGGYTNIGGHGGGLTGQDGVPYPSWPNSGGKGGTQIAGGAQGVACCSCPTYTTAGSINLGGNGSGDGAGGGGGGGGYFGGGGSCFAGGGGGSSYTIPAATSVTHTQGFQSGSGQIVISYTPSAPATPASITGTSAVCYNSTQVYTCSTVSGATSYTWTVPSGSVINSGQGTNTINVTVGNTSGNVTVTANNTCLSSAPQTFAMNVSFPPSVIITANNPICIGDNATLNAAAAFTGNWQPGNLSGTTVSVSPTVTTTYTLTATTASVCVSVDTITVFVNPLPVVSLGQDLEQCGGSVTLDAGNIGVNYVWSDGNTGQINSPSQSGNYSVIVTDANGCNGTDTVQVTINPIPTLTLSASSTLACLADAPVTLSATPAGGTWTGPAVTGNSFSPSGAGVGTHTVSYSYTDANGCSATDSLTIAVDICLGLGTNGLSNAIAVFPNPATTQIQIQSKETLLNYQVFDMTGREVARGTFAASEPMLVDVQGIDAGTYLFQATSREGHVLKTQFVKH